MATDTMHLGKKISRIRELKGMKQETLASLLGVSQQAISKLEQSEHVEDDRLEEIGKALGVNPEAIKNFNEEAAINLLNDIHDNKFDNQSNAMVYQMNINPIEKIIELYERMLKLEKEKNELLEKMMDKK